jgi:signal transduction histidine kinase
LYISRKFIEAMGGQLWAESQPGQGSTFSFSLPLAGHSMLTSREKSISQPA